MKLTRELASHFARTALGHVTREWPNKMDHVLTGPQDVKGPRELHPIFFGSFDWHSCVHGHWTLARLHRRFHDLPEADAIRALLDAQLTPEKVAGEAAYLARPSARGFERPYGWAWLLMLQAELMRHTTADGIRWAATLKPLADAFATRFRDFLPLMTYPVRAGLHSNTAFAAILARDYARAAGDGGLEAMLSERSLGWYRGDRDCDAREPSQSDFLSPTLIVAAAVRGAMTEPAFRDWFAGYLPRAAQGEPAVLFEPAFVTDRSDGQIAHLDGLNLSRAWCWRLIVEGLPAGDPLRARVEPVISAHLESAMDHVAGDYMGEHWLASFALLALDPDPA
ncbi:MAG TPA: DUF2891 domain-containing protein [Rhizomicrobium sp.]|nr:DUF2891 domain-containing protein [Rhizomicrobium sp.]